MHIMSSRTARSRDRLYAMSRCLIIVGVAMAEGWPDCHMALAQDGAPRFMSLPQPPYSDDWQGAYDDPPSEQGYCPPNSNCPPLLQNIEEARHVAIYGVLGLGTPVGSTGLELGIRPWRLLEVSGGLGLGVSVHNSVQWAFMPRLRLGRGHHAFVMGVGLSVGEYTASGPGIDDDPFKYVPNPDTVARVIWSNFELGGELWSGCGFAFRYFFGYGKALRASPTTQHPQLAPDLRAYDVLYTGIGLGYVF